MLTWSVDGVPFTSGEPAPIGLDGKVKFSGQPGTLECTLSADGVLLPSEEETAIGEITEASMSSCAIGGTWKAIGCTSVAPSVNLPWFPLGVTNAGGAKVIELWSFSVTLKFSGSAFCNLMKPTVITGNIIATPDDAYSIDSLALSGIVKAAQEGVQPQSMSTSGSLGVSPAGTYGILTTDVVSLDGTFGWIGQAGTMQCDLDGFLELVKGSEGRITSLKWSNCQMGGGLFVTCGTIKSATTSGLPLKVIDEGSKIRVPSFSLAIAKEKCATETLTGELFATPDKVGEISSTSLSGTLNSSAGGTKTWTGSASWSPAGVYGL